MCCAGLSSRLDPRYHGEIQIRPRDGVPFRVSCCEVVIDNDPTQHPHALQLFLNLAMADCTSSPLHRSFHDPRMSDLTNWLAGVVDPEPPPEPQIPADYLWKCPRRGRFGEIEAPKDSQLMRDSASVDSEGMARTTFGRKLRERSLAPPSDSIEDDVNEGISRDISKLRFTDPPVETMIISRTKDLPEAVRPLFTKLRFNANHSSGVVPLEVKVRYAWLGPSTCFLLTLD